MSIKTILAQEVEDELNELKKLQVGSDEHRQATESVVKMVDRVIEFDKNESDKKVQEENREIETQLELRKQASEKRNRIMTNVLTAISIGSGIILTVWGTKTSLKFEEEGTITTSAGRNFINDILRTFKKH